MEMLIGAVLFAVGLFLGRRLATPSESTPSVPRIGKHSTNELSAPVKAMTPTERTREANQEIIDRIEELLK